MGGFDTHFETQEFSRGHDDSQGRVFLEEAPFLWPLLMRG